MKKKLKMASCLKPVTLRALLHKGVQRERFYGSDCPNPEMGFSLAAVLLVFLAVVLGSVAIVNRTTAGRLASAFQVSNREAREIAEAGIVEIVSELNKEANRKLLVAGRSPSGWSASDASLVNPCTGFSSTGATQATSAPTATAISYGTTPVTSGTRQFQLESITYSLTPVPALVGDPPSPRQAFSVSSPNEPPDPLVSGTTKSQIKITVVGRVLNAAGAVVSETRVTREFEVAPKCCKRSFGRNRSGGTTYGTDIRDCFAPAGGAGLILSLNGGSIGGSNNTLTITDQSGATVTQAICRTNATGCTSTSTNTIGPTVSVVPKAFSAILPPPFPSTLSSLSAGSIADNSNSRYIRINNVTSRVQLCNSSLSTCTDATFCGTVSGSYYCKLTAIDTTNDDLKVDTSNGNVFFYLENPNATKTTSYNYLALGGNGTISQVYCPSGQTGTTPCATNATVAQSDRLNLFATDPGSFEIRGTGGGVAMNIFAPFSNVSLTGNASDKFAGRIWADGFSRTGLQGALVNNVPPSWCTTFPTNCPPASVTTGTISVDWIARSVSQSASF